MTTRVEVSKLAFLISAELRWLDECPFRRSEYYYETAQQTLEDQREALCEALREHQMPGIATKIEEITAELPANFDEPGLYSDIALALEVDEEYERLRLVHAEIAAGRYTPPAK